MPWERKALLKMLCPNGQKALNAFPVHFQSIAGLIIVHLADAPYDA
jgi:hypothetical protein